MDDATWPAEQLEALDRATNAFVNGDTSLCKQLWHHSDDVLLLSVSGEVFTGWEDLAQHFDDTAHPFRHSGATSQQTCLYEFLTPEVGCIVYQQRITKPTSDEPAIRRVTLVYRNINGHWAVIHQHSDPLVPPPAPPVPSSPNA